MPPPKERPSVADAACALHGQRLDQLDDQTASLRRDSRETHDALGSLRTETALLRAAVDSLVRRLDSSLPTPAQVVLMLLTVAVTVGATYLATHPVGSPVPSAHANSATH